MTHEEAFLQDILEHPDEEVPRLIFADWLLDQGDPAAVARGEFIHLQCDLLRTEDSARRDDLQARARQLLAVHQREWDSPLQRLGCTRLQYRRGFVEGVGMQASAFLEQASALFRCAPVSYLKLYDAAGRCAELSASPYLARVATLDLESNDLGDEDLEALLGGAAGTPHLGAVQTLLLFANRIGDAGLHALAGPAGSSLARLSRLDLSANALGEAVQALARSELLARLSVLDLQRNRIGDDGALALAGSPHVGGLTWLDLSKNPIGEQARAALRARFGGRVRVWG
jgi:uncharacterized protein (TIGR02996 family)